MITVFCGEDIVSSFNYYQFLKKDFKKKGYQVVDIPSSEIENISLWMGEAVSLFSDKKVFFTENLNKRLLRKTNLKINQIISSLIKDKSVEIYSWEEGVSSREIKFPKGALIKEFKPSETIFKLQEALYPGNLKNFLAIFEKLLETADEYFIFNMLAKHIRSLILAKQGVFDSKLFSWQIKKLQNQAKKWDEEKLINLYDSFYQIDVLEKTSTNPFPLNKSLILLLTYFL